MGMQKKKIKILKEKHDGKEEFILDCMKLNDPMKIGERVIRKYAEGKSAWLFMDTDFVYVKKVKDSEINMQNVLSILDENKLLYECKEKMQEKTDSVLGIPTRKKSVKSYKIAVKAAEGVLGHLDELFQHVCMFCYVCDENINFDSVFELHEKINEGGLEYASMLGKDGFHTFLYFDSYYKRIRIASADQIMEEEIEELLYND